MWVQGSFIICSMRSSSVPDTVRIGEATHVLSTATATAHRSDKVRTQEASGSAWETGRPFKLQRGYLSQTPLKSSLPLARRALSGYTEAADARTIHRLLTTLCFRSHRNCCTSHRNNVLRRRSRCWSHTINHPRHSVDRRQRMISATYRTIS